MTRLVRTDELTPGTIVRENDAWWKVDRVTKTEDGWEVVLEGWVLDVPDGWTWLIRPERCKPMPH